jgi:tetrahydromethanopterin S-methyltransferase subunit G
MNSISSKLVACIVMLYGLAIGLVALAVLAAIAYVPLHFILKWW